VLARLLQVRAVQQGELDGMPAVPITVRQLEAIVRISEALARMTLQPAATEAHVRKAIELFKVSTMDAVKSGEPACASSRGQVGIHVWCGAELDGGSWHMKCQSKVLDGPWWLLGARTRCFAVFFLRRGERCAARFVLQVWRRR
jgi:MCM AAA-lid domain